MVAIEHEIKLDFKDVLFRPKRSELHSRSQVSLERTFVFPHTDRVWTGVPLMVANMDTTGTFETAKVMMQHKCITVMHKHYSIEQWAEFCNSIENDDDLNYISVSCGTSDADINKVQAITNNHPKIPFICVDVANGYSQKFIDTVKTLRGKFPNHVLMAGNVVTNEIVEELIFAGADIVKVGIGPGSVCTTRKMTGVGYPQLSAVLNCSDAAHGLKGLIISDGGCTNAGDVAKAFGAGADFVMLGGMFAGHDESGGEIVSDADGKKWKSFYGMSSDTAMKKYAGGVAHYRSSEGKTVSIPYRGPIEGTLMDILGGIRSTCTYVGASKLKELARRTTFVRVSQQLNEVYAKDTRDSVNRKLQ